MTTPSTGNVTELLRGLAAGHDSAAAALFPLVYGELRALAGSYFRQERPDHTLQPTAIVHEAYLRLVGSQGAAPRDRAHFFALAAQVIRQVLVDNARKRKRAKRGGGWERITLDEAASPLPQQTVELLAVDDALKKLGELNERCARVVELRFFGGLECEAVADVLGISNATVVREWRFARAWLNKELTGEMGT